MEIETLEAMAEAWYQSRLKRSRALMRLEETVAKEVIRYLLTHLPTNLLLGEGVREALTEFKDMPSFIRVTTTPPEGKVDTGNTPILGESPLQVPLVELACIFIFAASVHAARRKMAEEYLLAPKVVDYLADKFPEYPHTIGRAMLLTADTLAHLNVAHWIGANECVAANEISVAVALAEKIDPRASTDIALVFPQFMHMRATLYAASKDKALEKSFPLDNGQIIDETDIWRLFFGETGVEIYVLESV